MLFAKDIILIEESQEDVNCKLEIWRETFESKDFHLSRNNKKYMEYKFNNWQINDNLEVKIREHVIPKVLNFRYFESIIQNNRKIDRDVTHRIQVGWIKLRNVSRVICDYKISNKRKQKFQQTATRPIMLYDNEC